jgi:hypothetical protein
MRRMAFCFDPFGDGLAAMAATKDRQVTKNVACTPLHHVAKEFI